MAVRNDVFILTLRQQVIFPAIRTSITIQPQTFSELCEFCEKHDSTHIGVVAVKGTSKGQDELYTTGTYCRIASHAQSTTKDGNKEVSNVTLTVEGQSRFQVQRFTQRSPFHVATVQLLEEPEEREVPAEVKALMQSAQQVVVELIKENSQGGLLNNLFGSGKRIRWPASPSVLADMIAGGLLQLSVAERQSVLETVEVRKRLELVFDLAQKVAEVQKMSKEISSKMRKRSQDELKETVLRRQLQELQREMRKLKSGQSGGDGSEGDAAGEGGEEAEDEDDITALRESLKKAHLPPETQKIANREMKRLQNIQPQHPEYTVCRNYLETLANLPWQVSTEDALDLPAAQRILEHDHYGLEKVKRRILEFLAVQKMRGDMKGPILCLHGPPGVGKTSLGKSVARALGRKFHRIALGGVRDEAELRGHRRTYIGSMPGAIIQAFQTLKVNNPVILLDEIDKLTRNAQFNPSGAMLELLDPEQNNSFKDHYLNTPFDLSKVLFLCTCNDLNTIDRPLLDRMEVIDLSGYTVEEKVHIATTHLLPKQRKLHALERSDPEPDEQAAEAAEAAQAEPQGDGTAAEGAGPERKAPKVEELPEEPRLEITRGGIVDLVSKWTMESGVRSLERRVAQICRWAALRLANPEDGAAPITGGSDRKEADELAERALRECGPGPDGRILIDAQHLPHIVGAELFEPDLAERLSVGVSMGLGVTQTGGSLLFVEATRSKGTGRLTITGQLGDVMRESVSTAMSLLRSKIYYALLTNTGEAHPVVRVGPASAAVAAVPDPAEGRSAESRSKFQEVFQSLIAQQDAAKDPFGNDDIHVHFPAGAIPKDGPSAGVATALALASLLLGRPVRSDTAVTGEITLRGHVLPVGGIRDKVLAAHRAGVRHVLLPFGNQRHVKEDIPASALADISVHFVKHVDEALAWAFAEDVTPWAPLAPNAKPAASPASVPGFALMSKI